MTWMKKKSTPVHLMLEWGKEGMPFFMGVDAMFAFLILFKINVANKTPQNMRQALPAYTAFLPSNIRWA